MREPLQTGDLVLVRERPRHWAMAALDWLIRTATRSPYSHAGVLLRDPPFVDTPGLYVWESGWEDGEPDPQDHLVKFGVQLTAWDTFVAHNPGELWVRRRGPGARLRLHDIVRIHRQVYRKPYDDDPLDWLEAAVREDGRPRKLDRFWCSALVAYILVRCGTLPAGLDWSAVRPADLSSESHELEWLHPYGEDTRLVGTEK